MSLSSFWNILTKIDVFFLPDFESQYQEVIGIIQMLFKLLVQIFEDTLILEHSLEFISIFETTS